METEKVANLLLSLSSTHTRAIDEAIRRRRKKTTARGSADGVAFVCKTCSREFDSFQALGGHSTSHNRARSLDPAAPTRKKTTATATTQKHECSICGLGFSMGQALGGHMRRHRAAMEAAAAAAAVGARRGEERFDLNQLPPLEDEDENENENENASEICGGGNGRGSSERRLLELFM